MIYKKLLLCAVAVQLQVCAITPNVSWITPPCYGEELRPTPWITEGAVAFLEGYFAGKKDPYVLEFGGGSSTVWMSRRTKNLYSVEHEKKWYDKVICAIEEDPSCNAIQYFLRGSEYASICDEFQDEFFDLIFIDGIDRMNCVIACISKLKPGGLLVFDNSEPLIYLPYFKKYLNGWESVGYVQHRPDPYDGSFYKGWETRWWIKPL